MLTLKNYLHEGMEYFQNLCSPTLKGSHSKFKLYWINFTIAELTYPSTTNPSPARSFAAFALESGRTVASHSQMKEGYGNTCNEPSETWPEAT